MIKNESKELLINQIYKQLDCKEEQTKDIIKHFLSDIQLFDKKQGDYGPHNISKFGILGVLIRSSDKIERLINLYGKSTLKETITPTTQNIDESVLDSWADLSVYGAIARTVTDNKWAQ
jgi:hypothetical protein|tara:strand:+ start:569 stop:925 length:357 start_codon:yes stop_codon:yes gene_type:complete